MKVSCPSCHTAYNLDDKRIPPGGAKIKCAKCAALFPVKREVEGLSPPPPVPPPTPAAIPLPSQRPTSAGHSPDSVPLPPSGPVSLPPRPELAELGDLAGIAGLALGDAPPPPSGPIPLPDFGRDSPPPLGSFDLSPLNEPIPPLPDLGAPPEPELGNPVAPDLGTDFGGIDLAPPSPSESEPLETLSFDAPAPAPAPTPKPQPKANVSNVSNVRPQGPGWRKPIQSALKAAEPKPLRLGPILRWAALGLLGLVVLAGGFLHFTRYGAFGVKAWLPAQVRPNSPESAALAKAKRALGEDTFKSYREAQRSAERLLQIRDFPEAKAVMAQAVFYLGRKYGAPAEETDRVTQWLLDIAFLGQWHPEVVKAQAGALLFEKRAAEADALLEQASMRPALSEDLELLLLLSEAKVQKSQPKAAKQLLLRLTKAHPDSAKAFAALGNLLQAEGQAEEATQAYQRALAANPDHLASSLELSSVRLLLLNDLESAEAALSPLLEDGRRALLSPTEKARAYALNGVILSRKKKPKEALAAFEAASQSDPRSPFVRKALAQSLLEQRAYEKARPLFESAVKSEPSNADLLEGYLKTLLGLGQISDALTIAQEAAGRFPNHPRVALLSGQIRDAMDQPAMAEADFKRALAKDPTLYAAHLALARSYLRFRKLSQARSEVELAQKTSPDALEVQLALGDLALMEKKPEDAKAAFDKALAQDADSPEAAWGLAKVALAKGEANAAIPLAQQALAKAPHLSGVRLTLGLSKWRLKDFAGALEELERARREEPSLAEIPLDIGAVKLDMGDLAGAEVQVAASLALDPSNAEAQYQMARLKNKKSEHAQAIDFMQKALERAPDRVDFRLEYGRILRDAKKLNDAIAEWKTVLKEDPKNSTAFAYLGTAQLEKGNHRQAVEYFREALALDPSRHSILTEIGDALFAAAIFPSAVDYYQRAFKADPHQAVLPFKIARTYTEMGQQQKAVEWYQRASKLDEKNPMPHWYLGFAYKEKGQRQAAVAAFKAYLAKKPDAEDQKAIEDEIYDLEHR